jgi:hypothetical protein
VPSLNVDPYDRIRNVGGGSNPYEYVVERIRNDPPGFTINLVRRERRHGLLRRHGGGGTIMFHRTFRPIGELDRLESYAAMLERVADHANAGTFGCFVESESEDGTVEVTLYERWFDGTRLHCDVLARRAFDASDDNSLVQGAEFRAEIEEWAEEHNARREAWYLDVASDAELRAGRAAERAAAADELAGILARRR